MAERQVGYISRLLSFVIPCYRSESTIRLVVDEIVETMVERDTFDYEIICVNDCSPDQVYHVLQKLAEENPRVKVISLAKNMGKHAAILAAFSVAQGEYIVNIDDDFQCPTHNLWRLLEPLELDQCDFATAVYKKKKQALWKNVGSTVNHWMSSVLLNKPQEIRFENFSIMKRFVMDEILKYTRPYPYLEGLVLRVTHRIVMVEMEERERADHHKTGFTFRKSMSLWFNGFTAFSVKPLRIATIIGFLTALCGFVLGIYLVIQRLIHSEMPAGYTSLIAVQLFSSGMIMIGLGLVGEYVGRIYICINNSPQYVIKETINI